MAKRATKSTKASKKAAKTTASKPRAPAKKKAAKKPAKKREVTEEQVWDAYDEHRSIRGAAEALGVTKWTVERVVRGSPRRMLRSVDIEHEYYAAGFEKTAELAIRQAIEIGRLTDGVLEEIRQAAEEGRITRILSREGIPLPVFDAIQMAEANRMLQGRIQTAQIASQLASSYRSRGLGGPAEQNTQPDVGNMSIEQMLAEISNSGASPPPLIEAKLEAAQEKTEPEE